MLRRRLNPKMGTREEGRVRSASHLQFVRGFVCTIFDRHECAGKIEAHHVRLGTDGAAGVKPGDDWAVPLCSLAHRELHDMGEATFQQRFGKDLKAVAARLWRTSPHRRKVEE